LRLDYANGPLFGGGKALGMLETMAFKHFWIKIAPPGVEAGALLRGTLICEDSERAIIDAVNEFSSESSRKTGRNWFVEILRPDLSPVFPPTPLFEFIRLADQQKRADRNLSQQDEKRPGFWPRERESALAG
jgi:hypothetical protein